MLGIKKALAHPESYEGWSATNRGRDDLNLRFSEDGKFIIAAVLYTREGRTPWYSQEYLNKFYSPAP